MANQNAKNINTNKGFVSASVTIHDKSNIKRILFIVCIFVLIILVTLSVNYQMSQNRGEKGAARAGQSFVSDLQKRDANAAHNLLSSEAKEAVSIKVIESLNKQPGGYLPGSLKKVEVNESDEKSATKTKTVVYEGKDAKSNKYLLTVNLVWEDGAWKILNFSTSSL